MEGTGRRDPIAVFMQEHEEALVYLQRLKKASQDLRKNGYTEKVFAQLLKASAFVDEEVRDHNLKEEQMLFPVIERYVDGPTAVLRQDHQQLAKVYRKLRHGISALDESHDDEVSLIELCEAVDEIVTLMVNHIHKENHILFPLVRKFISTKELRDVAKLLH